jgi:hypothetical protein
MQRSPVLRQGHLSLLHLQKAVFFRNMSQVYYWQQKSFQFLEDKGSWIQYCGLITISPSDKLHSRPYGCAVALNGLLGGTDPMALLYFDGNCSPLTDPSSCMWCSFLAPVPGMSQEEKQLAKTWRVESFPIPCFMSCV